MLRTEQKNKTFAEIIPSLTDTEKNYLNFFLAKETLTNQVSIPENGGVFVLAAINNQMSLAEKLLAAGSPVYEKAGKQSFLSYAAERGADHIVSLLIQYGANRFLADEPEMALRSAILQQRKTTVDLLLKHHPYDTIKDKLIFIECAKFNNEFFLKKLLHLSSHSEEFLIAALRVAIQFGSKDTTKLLLDSISQEALLKANVNLSTCEEKISQLLKNKLGLPELSNPTSAKTQVKITYSLKDINEVDAIFLLYQFAEKTAFGQHQRLLAQCLTANVTGVFDLLTKDEVADQLHFVEKHCKGEIKSLGYFSDIGINIYNQDGEKTIDITNYLATFKISYAEITTELNKLKPSKLETHSENNTKNDNAKILNHIVDKENNKIENFNCAKTAAENNSKLISVNEKLSILFNAKCKLIMMDNYYETDLPNKSFELLKQYGDMLSNAGLKVKLLPAKSLCGGLVKVAAKLEFYDALHTILDVLNNAMDITLNTVSQLSDMKLK